MTEPDRWSGEVCPFCFGEFAHDGPCSDERCGCEFDPATHGDLVRSLEAGK